MDETMKIIINNFMLGARFSYSEETWNSNRAYKIEGNKLKLLIKNSSIDSLIPEFKDFLITLNAYGSKDINDYSLLLRDSLFNASYQGDLKRTCFISYKKGNTVLRAERVNNTIIAEIYLDKIKNKTL